VHAAAPSSTSYQQLLEAAATLSIAACPDKMTVEELRRAFKSCAAVHHPDKGKA
jgi:hypothetical protein